MQLRRCSVVQQGAPQLINAQRIAQKVKCSSAGCSAAQQGACVAQKGAA